MNKQEAYIPASIRLVADMIEEGWMEPENSLLTDVQVKWNAIKDLQRAEALILKGQTFESLTAELELLAL